MDTRKFSVGRSMEDLEELKIKGQVVWKKSMRIMMMKERNNKTKNPTHQDQDKLRGIQEEVGAQQLEEPDQQEEEGSHGDQGMEGGVMQPQKPQLPGAKQGGDPNQMEEATLQGKKRRRRRTLGWR